MPRHPKPRKQQTANVLISLPADEHFAREILRGIFRHVHSSRPWNYLRLERKMGENTLANFPKDVPLPGMICARWSEKSLQGVFRAGIPVVNVVEIAGKTTIPAVLPDNYECGRVAARYFLERQFKNFAVAGLSGLPFSELRAKGFHDELALHGLKARNIDIRYIRWPAHSLESWPELEKALRDLPLPLALFATNDIAALNLINTCLQIGISVPGEIAVLGVDNDEICCELSPVPISSVIIPWSRLGGEAAALLDSLLDGNAAPTEPIRIAPAGVFSRRSTEMVAVGDPIVARALTFIMANAFRPISVADVVAATGASRRYIERRFIKVTGASPKETITALRINRVKRHLADNTLSLAEIAEKTGFSDAKALVSVFHQKTGLTISQYRAQIFNKGAEKPAPVTPASRAAIKPLKKGRPAK